MIIFALLLAAAPTSTAAADAAAISASVSGAELARELSPQLSAGEIRPADVFIAFEKLDDAEKEKMIETWKMIGSTDRASLDAYRLMRDAKPAARRRLEIREKPEPTYTQTDAKLPSETGRAVGGYFAGLGALIAYRLVFGILAFASIEENGHLPIGYVLVDIFAAPVAAAAPVWGVASGSNYYEPSFGYGYLGAMLVEGIGVLAGLALAGEKRIDETALLGVGVATIIAMPLGAAICTQVSKRPIGGVALRPALAPEPFEVARPSQARVYSVPVLSFGF